MLEHADHRQPTKRDPEDARPELGVGLGAIGLNDPRLACDGLLALLKEVAERAVVLDEIVDQVALALREAHLGLAKGREDSLRCDRVAWMIDPAVVSDDVSSVLTERCERRQRPRPRERELGDRWRFRLRETSRADSQRGGTECESGK